MNPVSIRLLNQQLAATQFCDAAVVVGHFGYRSGGVHSQYDYSLIASDIDSSFPVLMSGKKIDSLDNNNNPVYSGHVWVADQTMRTLWHMWVVHKTTNQLVYHTMVYRNFIHCNWGWNSY